jgi:hypothetical protein
MTTILFTLKLMMLANVSEVIVDRVEDNNVAVLCVGTDCTRTIATVDGNGGLREGQQVSTCETVGPRLDGTKVVICAGRAAAYIDTDGSRRANPYYTAGVR